MGRLSELKRPSAVIPVWDDELTVRPVSFNDIFEVAMKHGPQAALLFGKVVNGKAASSISAEQIRAAFYELAPEAPEMIAEIIAMVSDDHTPEGIEMARSLPLPTTVMILEAVFYMSITTESELKKLMESIIRMLSGVEKFAQQIRLPLSGNGSGDSDVE